MFCPAKVVNAETIPIPQEIISTTTTRELVIKYAKEYGVNEDLALYVADHESSFDHTQVGDMNIICKWGVNKGKPVRAKGIFQFTDCYWPSVTDEQAFDRHFNIKLAMPLLKDEKTCKQQFTTCRWFYSTK